MDFNFNDASSGSAILLLSQGLGNLMFALRNFALALALIFVIVGGIKYATSSGDPEKAAEARKTITWAIFAVIAALALWTVLFLFANIFGISQLNDNLSIPSPENIKKLIEIENPSYYKGN